MMTRSEVERLLAEEIAKTVVPLQQALEQAKRTIAMLQTKLYGVKAEASQVVLTAEGQQFIDPAWNLPQEQAHAPAPPVREEVVRTPRDRRGLVQRHPHLPLQETQAALPEELAEQVRAGLLVARPSGRYRDELVVPQERPFIRRVHEVEVVQAATGRTLMQVTADRIVEDGDFADETIHRLVIGKFLDALPFHRQIAQLARIGVDLPKQTVNDAINAWGEVFAPLAATIIEQILASTVVHADASWQRLQAKRACDRVHLWTILGGGQVAYRLTEDLTHARAAEIIPTDFAGKVVTDAWPGWFKIGLGPRLFLCNAHARRPFADWLKRNPTNPHAQRIVLLYRDLARLEHQPDDLALPQRLERRRELRSSKGREIMGSIRAEAERIATAYPPSHQLADGARYILDYGDGLTRFLDHPDVPPDNNAAENALRINALIRKNSLFIGSLAAGHRDAVAMTILHSCRLAGLNPTDYLTRVTPTLLLHRRGRQQDLVTLTPVTFAGTRKESRSR
jgi:hypothetical protein